MDETQLVLFAVLFSGVFTGLIQIAAGQALAALREIALNTRITAKSRAATDYHGLRVLGGILVLFGVLTILGTLLVGLYVVNATRF